MSKSLFERTSLKWDAMLNMTKIKLRLISDLDMYIFFEKSMRDEKWGFLCFNRHRKVNKKVFEIL